MYSIGQIIIKHTEHNYITCMALPIVCSDLKYPEIRLNYVYCPNLTTN